MHAHMSVTQMSLRVANAADAQQFHNLMGQTGGLGGGSATLDIGALGNGECEKRVVALIILETFQQEARIAQK